VETRAVFCYGSDRLHADEKGHLEPLPVAVDVIETELAKPAELNLHPEQTVRRVRILERFTDRGEESEMEALGRGGYVLEVGEDAAGFQEVEDLSVERTLPFVLEVVDGERGDDGIEAPERGQRLGEVVLYERDASVLGEALARRLQHGLGEVEAHADNPGATAREETEEPPVPCSEVEDAPGIAGHLFEHGALSLRAARIGVSPGEVAQRVFRGRPFFGRHARILTVEHPSALLAQVLERVVASCKVHREQQLVPFVAHLPLRAKWPGSIV
jgi:hypothetical protein